MSTNTQPPAVPWESVAYLSPARLTRMTHISLPGSVTGTNASIATLNPIYANMIVTCTQSGGGFVKDQTYIRNTDNTNWIGLSGGVHLHDDITETSGGLFSNVLLYNQQKAYYYHNMSPVASEFRQEGSGTTSYDSTAGVLKLNTGTSQGNWYNCSRSGVSLSFSQPSQFMFKGNVAFADSTLGNVTSYIGVGVSAVNASPGTQLQYGLQVCDSAGIDRNWEVVNANGSTKVAEATTEPAKSATAKGYRLRYTPGYGTQFWVNGILRDINTQAFVASGSSPSARTISFGIKTNNTSEKSLYVYGVSLIGGVSDTQWA